MRIIVKKKYLKQLAKLTTQDRELIEKSLLLFKKNPFHRDLRNHILNGKYKGFRSIDAAYDLRIIFEEKDGTYELVTLITLGSHSHLYGK